MSAPHRPSSHTTTVWLARHAEVFNPANILYGRLPRHRLSDEGRRQARLLGEYLADRPLDAMYSSPMLRARQTASAIRAFHPALKVREDRRLNEVLTSWEGRSAEELNAIAWNFYLHRESELDETLEAVRNRMRSWFATVLHRHAGGEVVGVTHGDPFLVGLADLRGLPMDLAKIRPAMYPPTASVARLTFDSSGAFVSSEMIVPYEEAAA